MAQRKVGSSRRRLPGRGAAAGHHGRRRDGAGATVSLLSISGGAGDPGRPGGGASPGVSSLLATIVGGVLLVYLLLPPTFSPVIARIENALELLIYLVVGCAVSLLTSQAQHARRSAERARRRLDTIQQAMTDAVMVYDGEGQLMLWNEAAEQLLPLQPTDDTSHALPARSEPFLPRNEQGQSLPVEEWPIRRILNGEVLTGIHAVDVLVRLVDGRDVLMNFSGAPIRDADGMVIGGVTIGRDVTERRRLVASERRLHAETQARQALLQLILDALPSSVYLVHGRDARLVLANRAAAEVWGASWPPGQPMGEFLAQNDIRIVDMQRQPLALEQLPTMRALVQGETVLGHQEMIYRPDGTVLPVLVNAVALGMQHLTTLPAEETARATAAPEPAAIVVTRMSRRSKKPKRSKTSFSAWSRTNCAIPLPCSADWPRPCSRTSVIARCV